MKNYTNKKQFYSLESTINKIFISLIILTFIFSNTLAKEINQTNHHQDDQLRKIIFDKNLTGNPKASLDIPDINSPKAQLGMKLFFTKTLGGDKTTACATCHHPVLGGGDDLSLSIGIEAKNPNVLGINRKLKTKQHIRVPRNAPTTFNIAFWKKALFHDMRIEQISEIDIYTPDLPYPQTDPLSGDDLVQAQARFPITSDAEMRGNFMENSFNQTFRRALANRLKKNWLNEFRNGFSSPMGTTEELITEQNFSEAISAYERSQVFTNTPWRAFIEGQPQAISKSAKKGAILFFTAQNQGGAGCDSCHSGDFFTDERAYNTAMPQIGPGTDSGVTGSNDYGCNQVTKKESDMFKFRTPTLLNVEVTGPWGHDGAYTSLEAITEHMLSPLKSAQNYNPKQIKQKKITIKDQQKNTLEMIRSNIDISPKPRLKKEDISNIVSFLKTLTDPCVKNKKCLSPWIPASNTNDPDGMTLHAKF